MRAKPLLLLCAVLFSIHASAQDQPGRFEVFGGYSLVGYYYYPAYTGPWTLSRFNGWEGSASAQVFRHFGVEGDFGGAYGRECSSCGKDRILTYMGGPRVAGNFRRATLSAHFLVGELTYRSYTPPLEGGPAFTQTDTSFAMAIGGGANLWVTRRVGARLFQFDYLRNNNTVPGYFAHPGQHANFRFSTGIVFRF